MRRTRQRGQTDVLVILRVVPFSKWKVNFYATSQLSPLVFSLSQSSLSPLPKARPLVTITTRRVEPVECSYPTVLTLFIVFHYEHHETAAECLDPNKNIPVRLAPSRRDTCRQLRFSWPPCQKYDTQGCNQASGVTGSHGWLSYGNVLGIYGLGPSNLSPYAFVAGLNKRECSSSCYR